MPPVGDELGRLAQPLQIEQVRDRTGRGRDGGRAVRVTESNRGMAAVRQADDDVRVGAVPNADDGQLLSAERMMGMGDRHQSRRRRGEKGSALGLCQPPVVEPHTRCYSAYIAAPQEQAVRLSRLAPSAWRGDGERLH